jgi:succinoglycan biosynthesis protein ExoM
LFARALLQLIAAAGLTVIVLPLGRHRAAHWLIKASANLGKLSTFMGWHYREYA